MLIEALSYVGSRVNEWGPIVLRAIRGLKIDPIPVAEAATVMVTGRYWSDAAVRWKAFTKWGELYWPQGDVEVDRPSHTWHASVNLGPDGSGHANILIVEMNNALSAMVRQYELVAEKTGERIPIRIADPSGVICKADAVIVQKRYSSPPP